MRVMVTGHRPPGISPQRSYKECPTFQEVRKAFSQFLSSFAKSKIPIDFVISGMALGVDQWFASIARLMNIPFHAYIPFVGQEGKWPQASQNTYRALLDSCSRLEVVCPGEYAAWKMQKRNETMADNSDIAIAVWNGTPGGTANCVSYLQKLNKPFVRYDPLTKYFSFYNFTTPLLPLQEVLMMGQVDASTKGFHSYKGLELIPRDYKG